MTDAARRSPVIFDGHNDLILRLINGDITAERVRDGCADGHIDLPRAKHGGLAGGFFAIFVPSPAESAFSMEEFSKPAYDLPLPPPVDHATARVITEQGFAAARALEEAGVIRICTDVDALEAAMQGPSMAAVLHIEGAEAIGPDIAELEGFHARGLRSLGPVWSRPTIFGEGVPFRFPSGPDIGPGLTEAGKRLVRECNRLKIMIDLSHLNAKGFDDVARLSDAPLVATHSNALAVCEHARNLSDRQLSMIAETDGMVGINLATGFLRPDGQMRADTGLDDLLRHLDHLLQMLGEDRVGFGSDFDGAIVPEVIGDCSGLPNLRQALRQRGYNEALMQKLCHGNWMRVLRKTWEG
ncbi:membrane dipeptidase [Pseudooceanicola antarcticus]|uniref:Membrane dipeptidase n=1 Tax=Pseudooceanicola antarcticus TaxID=1247613 RepID=A0A285HXK1_9RHOB|nr:dipeptidase [Pseudooceanicola antarcticus]PJE27481.1 membrane dipeptidase [Pseudooceanicola antarcticus]SNY39431.1 membrane dipeptidase [Pseudooceanicola antarcticus]